MTSSTLETRLASYVQSRSARLVQILSDLVRLPSENTPPVGNEQKCQRYVFEFLRKLDCEPLMYSLDEVPGLREHPLFFPGRDYRNRPNVGARLHGHGSGRSLLLSGHVDTVPRGTLPWTKDPFGAEVDGNRLFGRGANDMKGGVATNLFVVEALHQLGIALRGNLLFETVVDEEFGGVNGTLAGRLKGFNAGAAIISEPSALRICPAQRGGRIAHVMLEARGGVLSEAEFPAGVTDQLTFLLARLPDFAALRRNNAPAHELYAQHSDPVPVAVTKIVTSPWGTSEPITVPEECKLEIYWQAMPGEAQADVERDFVQWMESLRSAPGSPFANRPKVSFPIRWLPGSAINANEPLATELSDCANRILGKPPVIAGIEGPCDMFVFHQVTSTPAVLWGGKGGNTHGSDEYVEIDSLIDAARTLLLLTCDWCGVA